MPYQSTPTTIACDVAEMTQLARRLGDYFTQLQEITIPSENINFGSADVLSAYRGFNVDFTTRRDILSVWLNRPHMPSTKHEINSFITKKQALRPSKKTKAPTSRKLSSFTSLGRTRLQEGVMFESGEHNPLTDIVVLGLPRSH